MTNQLKTLKYKINNRAYWPLFITNLPLFVIYLFYAMRHRSLFYFNLANTSIQNGGFLTESKQEIYGILPQKYLPETIFLKPKSSLEDVLLQIKLARITFPFIIKPDKGMKGLGVQLIKSKEDLEATLSNISFDFIIQEYIDFPNEVGVFYVRLPSQTKGKVTGIGAKKFIQIVGDGVSTIQQQILKQPNLSIHYPFFQKTYDAALLSKVLDKGEVFNLLSFGNRLRGSEAIDLSDWLTDTLNECFDNICSSVDGFYYGRFDIRFNSKEELENGQNFKIIELNGVSSDPFHVFDQNQFSLFSSWKELSRHYIMLGKVCYENYQQGNKPLSFWEAKSLLKEQFITLKTLKQYHGCLVS